MKTKLLPSLQALLLALGACAAVPPVLSAVPDAAPRVLLYGEQHDQPDHQRQVAQAVRERAAQGRLAAVVVEMAERGASTAGLGAGADEGTVREALHWNSAGWPWDTYRDVVMSAVRAGVPVLGGNLPRADMRSVMGDAALERLLPGPVNERLAAAIRDGHCGQPLPEQHASGMLRVQIARDRAMARTIDEALQAAPSGAQVLLLSGAQHAARDRGVPLHLQQLGLQGPALQVTLFDGSADLPADRRLPAQLRSDGPDPCDAFLKKK